MNRLFIILLLFFLFAVSTNAAMVDPSDVSFGPNGASNYVLDISKDENNLTTLSKSPQTSQFTSETDTVPPTPWIVGLGLCLVFLGYKMKKNAK
jgi:hypothetical protein